MHWDSEKSTLTIGDRKGDFPGMLKQRTFRVVFVHKDHGTGVAATDEADKVVTYTGTKLEVRP
jgi:alpha-D-xyloside xylohydrolase